MFRSSRSWGMLLLAIWVIITGVLQLGFLDMPNADKIMGILAIVAGALLLLNR